MYRPGDYCIKGTMYTVYAFIPFEQGIQVFEAFIGTQISNKYAVHVHCQRLYLFKRASLAGYFYSIRQASSLLKTA